MTFVFLRNTFFDQIDEEIDYPRSYWSGAALGVADEKIITTSYKLNFTLFRFENGWTETAVEFPDSDRLKILSLKNKE